MQNKAHNIHYRYLYVSVFVLLIIILLFLFFSVRYRFPRYISTTVVPDHSGFIRDDVISEVVRIVSKKKLDDVLVSDDWSRPGQIRSYDAVLWEWRGVFVSQSGLILTNKHVVDNLDANYFVVVYNGKTFPVDKIWYHSTLDLALIQIAGYSWNTIAVFADKKDMVSLSDKVFSVDMTANDYVPFIVTGVVRNLDASFNYKWTFYSGLILSDIKVAPGSSGGPLLNSYGEVVALITAQDVLWWSYAIPFFQDELLMFIKSIKLKM